MKNDNEIKRDAIIDSTIAQVRELLEKHFRSICKSAARSRLTTATTFAPKPARLVSARRFESRASSLNTSGHCSAKGAGRSGGLRCPAIQKISLSLMTSSSPNLSTTRDCAAGSPKRARKYRSRDFRRGCAGWDTANGPSLVTSSITISKKGRSQGRS